MINDISHSVLGLSSSQSKRGSDSASRVDGAQGVEKVHNPGFSAPVSQAESAHEAALADEKLSGMVEDLNQYAQSVKRQLQFSVDDDSGKTLIKVLDAETGDTIRQIPAEEVLNMQKRLKEVSDMIFSKEEAGMSLLFSEKA